MENNEIKKDDQTELSISTKNNEIESGKKYSFWGALTTVILVVVILIFCNRLIFDVNRLVNPVVNREYGDFKKNRSESIDVKKFDGAEMSAEILDGPFSEVRLYYPKKEENRYLMYKLIIYSAIIIPLFIMSFVLFYFKKGNYSWRLIVVGIFAVSAWLMLGLLRSVISFIMESYENFAAYVVLAILILFFGGLTIYFQSKHIHKK